jgi:hypothetical protein
MHLKHACLLALCAGLVVLTGCGKSTRTGAIPVVPVNGTVTYQGKPVAEADITFYPKEQNIPSSFGRTDDKGAYSLTTYSSNDGSPAGWKLISITKVKAPVTTESVASIDSPEYVPPPPNGFPSVAPPKPEIPAKYASQETSGLTANIQADGTNTVDFELKD